MGIRRSVSTVFVVLAMTMTAIFVPFSTANAQTLTPAVPSTYVPLLQATDAADLGLALSNPTVTEATVKLTARSYAGAPISGNGITNPATIKIPALGQRAL